MIFFVFVEFILQYPPKNRVKITTTSIKGIIHLILVFFEIPIPVFKVFGLSASWQGNFSCTLYHNIFLYQLSTYGEITIY